MRINSTFINQLQFLCWTLVLSTSVMGGQLHDQEIEINNIDLLHHKINSSNFFKITGFPDDMRFKKLNLYTADAQIKISSDRETIAIPSKRLFYISYNTENKVAINYHPETKKIGGHLRFDTKTYHISSNEKNANSQILSFTEESEEHSFDCANDHLGQWDLPFPDIKNNSNIVKSKEKRGGNPTYQATIVVDTDNEFLWNKFNNNTFDAVDWIEELFANMNVIYESEVDLNLKIRSIILRVDNSPAGNPDFNQDPNGFNNSLNSFSNFWSNQGGNSNSTFTALLAGKDISSFSFSGIAWVNVYCNNGFGYSVNRIGSNFSAGISGLFVGHEIGHNLGSSHTHCEQLANGGTQFVDNCYSNEQNGCYVGPTSCPSGGQGTLMSYCHAPANGFDGNGGPAMGPPSSPNCNTSTDIHPLIANKIDSRIQSNYPNCIKDFTVLSDLIFADGFN